MTEFQLVPRPGFSPNIGNGSVKISGQFLPYLINGDQITITLDGHIATQQEVGHKLPGETVYTFDGLMTNGSLVITTVVSTTGLHSILESPALIITNGILPQNGNFGLAPQPGIANPWNTAVACQYGLPNSPIPATPGTDNLVSEVEASWQPPHVSVANMRTDNDKTVTYMTAPPDAKGPYVTTVPNGECLDIEAATRLAVALGGTVILRPPRVWKDIYVFPIGSPQPNVNWIAAPGILSPGVMAFAQGSELANSLDTRETGKLKQNIINTFQAT